LLRRFEEFLRAPMLGTKHRDPVANPQTSPEKDNIKPPGAT
jgi:hypothetical protein